MYEYFSLPHTVQNEASSQINVSNFLRMQPLLLPARKASQQEYAIIQLDHKLQVEEEVFTLKKIIVVDCSILAL